MAAPTAHGGGWRGCVCGVPPPPQPARVPGRLCLREGEVVSLGPVPEGPVTLFPGEEGDGVQLPRGFLQALAGRRPGSLAGICIYLYLF